MMTRKDAVLLASRAFALYLICWGLSDVTYLPQVLFSFRHYPSHSYLWTSYRIDMTFYLVRIAALFTTATWLLKSGKGVENFLLPASKTEGPGSDAQPSPHHNAD